MLILNQNIEYQHGFLSDSQLLKLYQRGDCILEVSRGEGFGMPPLEAMATGAVPVVTNYSGMVDFVTPDDGYFIPVDRMVSVHGNDIMDEGLCAEPSYSALVDRIRYIGKNRDEAWDYGEASAKRVHRDWTWIEKTREIFPSLNKLVPFDLLETGLKFHHKGSPRVTFLSSNFYPEVIGGGEISNMNLAKSLSERGYWVDAIYYKANYEIMTQRNNVWIWGIKTERRCRTRNLWCDYLDRVKPNLVFNNSIENEFGVVLLREARNRGIKIIDLEHSDVNVGGGLVSA